MNNFIKPLAFAAFALAASQIAQAGDGIIGKWHAEFDSQIGMQKYTYDFKMDGTNLVGRAIGERDTGTNDVALTGLKFAANTISFFEPLTIQDNNVSVEYTGSLTNDELHLHRKVGEFAEYDIVAKRVNEAPTDAVAGKWQGQFDSQIGVQKYTYEFKVDGTNLTGTAIGITDNGTNNSTITEGKILQDSISFIEPLNLGGNEIRIEYAGKVSGDEIKLHRKVGDFAEEDLVVKRDKADLP